MKNYLKFLILTLALTSLCILTFIFAKERFPDQSEEQIKLIRKENGWIYMNSIGIEGVSMSKDGNYIITYSKRKIYLINNEGKLLWNHKFSGSKIVEAKMSRDGKYIIVVTATDSFIKPLIKGRTYLFNQKGKILWRKVAFGSPYISDNGSLIGISTHTLAKKDRYSLFYTQDGKQILKNKIKGLKAISSDGKYVLSLTKSGKVFFYNKDGDMLWSVNFSPDTVKSTDIFANVILIIKEIQGEKTGSLSSFGGEIPYGLMPMTLSSRYNAIILKNDGQFLGSIKFYNGKVLLSANANYMIVSERVSEEEVKRAITLFKREKGPVWTFKKSGTVHTDIYNLEISNDGKHVIATFGSNEGENIHYLFDENGKIIWQKKDFGYLEGISYDGKRFITRGVRLLHFYDVSRTTSSQR